MTDTLSLPVENPQRFHFNWLLPALFRPRQAFAKIASQTTAVWLTPLLVLTLIAVLQVIVAGPIKQQAALNAPMELPPDFQYYTPEDQAQFQQAMAATQSPVFIYVMPALVAIVRVWAGWLLVGGLLYLVLTMLGGRGATSAAMNLVAWSSLPFAVRDLVRVGVLLVTRHLITKPGISGFALTGEGWLPAFMASAFSMIDIYLFWHIVLLVIGVRAASGLSLGKTVGGVVVVILLVVAFYALLASLAARLSGLTVARPFF